MEFWWGKIKSHSLLSNTVVRAVSYPTERGVNLSKLPSRRHELFRVDLTYQGTKGTYFTMER